MVPGLLAWRRYVPAPQDFLCGATPPDICVRLVFTGRCWSVAALIRTGIAIHTVPQRLREISRIFRDARYRGS
jgi:hypothetical protein